MFKFIVLVFVISCSQAPKSLDYLLLNNYANLSLNNTKNKLEIINNISSYLNGASITEKNISFINALLYQLNDGHVILQRNSKNMKYVADLIFYPGTEIVKSCLKSCTPSVSGKFEIISVDNLKYLDWVNQSQNLVPASTPWGKRFRISRTLQTNDYSKKFSLKLKNSNGAIVNTVLNVSTLLNESEIKPCVSGERKSSSQYLIKVSSLWCNKTFNSQELDHQIFKNFKNSWDKVINQVSATDEVVLDLRENNGGGDDEVSYVLNTFLKESIFLYRYKLLKTSITGKRDQIRNLIHFNLGIWGPITDQYTNEKFRPFKKLYTNELKVLISAGCFSSCEGLAEGIKSSKRGILIGTRTHGGIGAPIKYPIANSEYSINLPSAYVTKINNEAYEGIGILPDIIDENLFIKF